MKAIYYTADWKTSVNQEAAFEYYMGQKIVLGKLYKSPLREDKNPTAAFFYSERGTLYFNDFGIAKMYSVIDFVKAKFNLNYEQALSKMIADIPLMKDGAVEIRPKEGVQYSFTSSPLEEGMYYWNKYKIPKNIVAKYSFFVKNIYRNEEYWARSTKGNPIFAYKFPSGNIKIYRPLSGDKSKKWGGNANTKDIGGLFQLPQKGTVLFITSSIKDIMVLRQHGFNAVCFNGEGYGTSDKSYSEIKPFIVGLKKRFKHIIIFLDSDSAGIDYSMKLSYRIKCKWVSLPREKDISDFQKKFGVNKTFKQIKKLIKKTLQYDNLPF